MTRLARIAACLLGFLLPALGRAAEAARPSFFMPPQVSASGREIDQLYLVILAIVTVIFVVTEGLLLYSVIAFRARPGRKASFFHGSASVELILAAIPALILLYITLASSSLWTRLKIRKNPGKEAVHIQVLAEQFAWNFRYPGPDHVFGTADDILSFAEAAVPTDTEVVFHFSAKDVIHSFFLPESRLKQDCVPGLLTRSWTQWDFIPVWDLEKQERVLLSAAEYAAAPVAVSGYKFNAEPAKKKTWFQASDSAKINYLEYHYARDPEQPLKVVQGGKASDKAPRYVLHYFEIGCAQLCGTSHFAMRGTVRVLPPADYQAWLAAQGPDSFLAEKWAGAWDKYHPEFNKAL